MTPISEELEHGLVAGVVRGLVKLELVPEASLSKNGQAILAAAEFLECQGMKTPYSKNSLVSAAVDVAGADKTVLRPYLDTAMKVAGGSEDVLGILQKIHERDALTNLIELAGKQLANRQYDPTALKSTLTVRGPRKLVPLCDLIIDDKLPPIPTGYAIPSLPTLTKASGGVMGVWAIGGKSKLGKSTLGLQIALEMPTPVLYYDMELGPEVMLYRIGQAFGGDVPKVKRQLKRFYHHPSVTTLDEDLLAVPAPAVIVIDSLQKVQTDLENRRGGIDAMLAKFERLKRDGYTTILISEVNGMGGFKETSEIEYTVDFGMQLRREYGGGGVIASIVANRHRRDYGDLCVMERVNEWWIREGDGAQQDDGGL